MSITPPQRALIKPVYDVSNYGHDLTVQFSDTLNLKSITSSTSTFEKFSDSIKLDGTNTTVFPLEDMDLVLSNSDTFGIMNEGDNTAFDRIYSFEPDMSAQIYKVALKVAVGLSVSAYTSGNYAIKGIRIIIKQMINSDLTQYIDDFTIPSTLANLTTTGSQVFIAISDRHYTNFRAEKGRNITVQVIIDETVGVGTRQIGIMPCFPFQKEAILRPITTSCFTMHIHPTLDHGFPIFRDQNSMQLLDYSGLENPEGSGVG